MSSTLKVVAMLAYIYVCYTLANVVADAVSGWAGVAIAVAFMVGGLALAGRLLGD